MEFNGERISKELLSRMETLGITPNPDAITSLSNYNRCAKLAQSVWAKMERCGEKNPEVVYEAIKAYADVLSGRWHGSDVLADRIVKRYYKTHDLPQPEDAPRGEEEDEQGDSEQGERHEGDGDGGERRETESDEYGDDGEEGSSDEQEEGDEEGDGEGEGQGQQQEQSQEPPRMPDGRIMPKEFPILVSLLKRNKFVMLVGPAGTGKSEMVKDAFTILGRPLYVCTAPQMAYDITGFVDAHGRYIQKPFSKGFMEGGGVLMDEIDRSSPEALIAMNAPLANGIMFIEGVGQMDRHKDFLFVATANTAGTGADMEYVTANQLDASTRDRLIFLRVEYDENVDLECAQGDKKLVQFAREWRKACEETGVTNALFTYRGIKEFKELSNMPNIGIPGAIEMVLVKYALPKDTLQSIRGRIKTNNVYAKALDVHIAEMKETF